MSDAEGLTGRDLYLRFNKGKVRHFRVWDGDRFIAAQVEAGRDPKKDEKDHYEVTTATAAEYRAEHRR